MSCDVRGKTSLNRVTFSRYLLSLLHGSSRRRIAVFTPNHECGLMLNLPFMGIMPITSNNFRELRAAGAGITNAHLHSRELREQVHEITFLVPGMLGACNSHIFFSFINSRELMVSLSSKGWLIISSFTDAIHRDVVNLVIADRDLVKLTPHIRRDITYTGLVGNIQALAGRYMALGNVDERAIGTYLREHALFQCYQSGLLWVDIGASRASVIHARRLSMAGMYVNDDESRFRVARTMKDYNVDAATIKTDLDYDEPHTWMNRVYIDMSYPDVGWRQMYDFNVWVREEKVPKDVADKARRGVWIEYLTSADRGNVLTPDTSVPIEFVRGVVGQDDAHVCLAQRLGVALYPTIAHIPMRPPVPAFSFNMEPRAVWTVRFIKSGVLPRFRGVMLASNTVGVIVVTGTESVSSAQYEAGDYNRLAAVARGYQAAELADGRTIDYGDIYVMDGLKFLRAFKPRHTMVSMLWSFSSRLQNRELLRHVGKDYVFTCPDVYTSTLLNESSQYERLPGTVRDRHIPEHVDHIYDCDLLAHTLKADVMTISQYVTSVAFSPTAQRHYYSKAPTMCDPSSLDANIWRVVCSGTAVPHDQRFQTIFTSNTEMSKCTFPLQQVYNLEKDAFYAIRAAAIGVGMWFDGALYVGRPMWGTEVNGYVNGRPVVVSGHMINIGLSLASCDSYFKQVILQAQIAAGMAAQSDVDKFADYSRLGLLAEHTAGLRLGDIWHSWLDYLFVIPVYLFMCKVFRLPIRIPFLRAIVRLIRWMRKQPKVECLDSYRSRLPQQGIPRTRFEQYAFFDRVMLYCTGRLRNVEVSKHAWPTHVKKSFPIAVMAEEYRQRGYNVTNGYLKGVELLSHLPAATTVRQVVFLAEAPGYMIRAAQTVFGDIKWYANTLREGGAALKVEVEGNWLSGVSGALTDSNGDLRSAKDRRIEMKLIGRYTTDLIVCDVGGTGSYFDTIEEVYKGIAEYVDVLRNGGLLLVKGYLRALDALNAISDAKVDMRLVCLTKPATSRAINDEVYAWYIRRTFQQSPPPDYAIAQLAARRTSAVTLSGSTLRRTITVRDWVLKYGDPAVALGGTRSKRSAVCWYLFGVDGTVPDGYVQGVLACAFSIRDQFKGWERVVVYLRGHLTAGQRALLQSFTLREVEEPVTSTFNWGSPDKADRYAGMDSKLVAKLSVFTLGYEEFIFLDADLIIVGNLERLLSGKLKGYFDDYTHGEVTSMRLMSRVTRGGSVIAASIFYGHYDPEVYRLALGFTPMEGVSYRSGPDEVRLAFATAALGYTWDNFEKSIRSDSASPVVIDYVGWVKPWDVVLGDESELRYRMWMDTYNLAKTYYTEES